MVKQTQVPTEDGPDWRTALEIMDDSRDLYEDKNDDYGDSWKLVGKTMAMWLHHNGIDELSLPVNEHTMNSLGLFTRRMDKLIREFTGWFVTNERSVSESIAETHMDDVPYSAMHCQLAEEYACMNWSDFTTEDTR